MKIRYLFLSVVFLLAVFIVSCGKKEGEAGGSYGLSTKNNVVYWILSEITKLIPNLTHDAQASYAYQYIWEPLNYVNPRTQQLIPWIASLPELSEDHKVYTYTINPKVTFSDGVPLTGEDVIFTFKATMNPLIPDLTSIRNYLNAIDSVGFVGGDKYKVAFYLNKAYFMMDNVLGGGYVPIIPKHIFDKNGINDKISWKELKSEAATAAIKEFAAFFPSADIARDFKYQIGTGPYLLKEWITNDRLTLKKNPNYWAKGMDWANAYPDEITFKTINDQNAAVTALKGKEIDFMELVNPPNNWFAINQPFIKKDTAYYNVYSYLAWNSERPLFRDKKVRFALSKLVDRDAIIKNIFRGYAKKIESPIIFTQPNYYPGLKPIDYDINGAKQLLTEAGWTDSDGDGILDKVVNGKKVPFAFTFLTNSGNEVRKQVLLITAEQLRKVGIKAEVQSLEFSVFLENLHTHNFDACYSSLSGNASEDDPYQTWHSSQAKNKGSNWYSFKNAEADQVMENIRIEFDREKRNALNKRLVEIIYDEQPVTFLWSQPQMMARIDRFDNVEIIRQRPCVEPKYWIVRGSGTKADPNAVSTVRMNAVAQ
jgi:peptide/nickel transport system substrate-binding protein